VAARGARLVRTACPLDCWDTCTLLVEVVDGRAVAVRGDPDHEITRGFCCAKAQMQLERACDPARLRRPLIRRGGKQGALVPAGWDEALDLVAERLLEARERHGAASVFFSHYFGSGGALKALDRRFFSRFGAVTAAVGDLCFSAGLAAQARDFGANRIHDPTDCANARMVIIWGRNPVYTNVHAMPFLSQARQRGARIVCIDPLPTATARWSDAHIKPRPGTDAELALAMAHVIIRDGLLDADFVAASAAGFDAYARLAEAWPPARAQATCGVAAADIVDLARAYAWAAPGCIMLGYGPQRYKNGGQAMRAVDALAALTGNLGVPGGGANYGSNFVTSSLGDLGAVDGAHAAPARTIARPTWARGVLEARDPPITVLFMTRSNFAAQLPNASLTRQAMQSVGFVVAVDLVLSDSAAAADVVLPCASFLEEEDILACSWHNYITYGERAVEPPDGVMSDVRLWAELARRLGFGDEFGRSPAEWASLVLAPLKAVRITAESARGRSFRHPWAPRVPWEDGEFLTPSGRFEFLDGLDAQLGEAADSGPLKAEYPLILITPQHRDTLHSQFYDRVTGGAPAAVEVAPRAAAAAGVADGDEVTVESPRGSMRAVVRVRPAMRDDVALIYSGGDLAGGRCVNVLTPDLETDVGQGAAYYDCRCRIVKR
jgi:anaerobic selenocysteine-containing dehydrogenase